MKRHIITIIITLAAVSAYAQQDNYTISGDAYGGHTGKGHDGH